MRLPYDPEIAELLYEESAMYRNRKKGSSNQTGLIFDDEKINPAQALQVIEDRILPYLDKNTEEYL